MHSQPLTEDEIASEILDQIVADSVYGTYGELPTYWEGKWEEWPERLVSSSLQRHDDDFIFDIDLDERLFPVSQGGLQHLVNLLAGDLFTLQLIGISIDMLEIREVRLPPEYEATTKRLFRGSNANDIDAIGRQFGLLDKQSKQFRSPLLAYSFKPRVGIRLRHFREIAQKVLEAGFNLVELDTRNLQLDGQTVNDLVDIAKNAASLDRNHVTRFSPNLSIAAPRVTELVEQFASAHEKGPVVIKIDGGLDGMSACQAVRNMRRRETDNPPVITSYPLLRSQLGNHVPPDFFIRLLALSGADIVYPGGRPNLPGGERTLGSTDRGQVRSGIARYQGLLRQGWPMPTIAGGVAPGQLHAYYELLGPRVAFFLGGAVALHKDGPLAGAALCVQVMREAVQLGAEADDRGDDVAVDIDTKLKRRMEAAYLPSMHYVSPRALLKELKGLKTWRATSNP